MEAEYSAGSIALGIAVFIVFGAFIGWLVYRHVKYTVAGTKAHIKAIKQAVGEAKEEIKLANERKASGEGWTLPQTSETLVGFAAAKEEIVFGYNDEQMNAERGEQAKKGIIAGVVLLVFAGLCVLAGALSASSAKKMAAYPTVQARVVNHKEVTRTDDDGDEYLEHYIDIEWVVDGKAYTDTNRPSKEYNRETITVHYNPDKPEKVYFQAQVQAEGNVFWYVIAGIIGLLGLGVAISAKKDKRKLKEEP